MRIFAIGIVLLFVISCTDWDLLQDPQSAVVTVKTITDTTVTLQWTSPEKDNFTAYYVYQGEGSVVDTSDKLVDTLRFHSDTVYTVQKLLPDTRYSFRVVTIGANGKPIPSNTVEVRTYLNLNKATLKLHTPDSTMITDRSVVLRWSREWNWSDTASYRIYMDSAATVDSLDSLVGTVSNAMTTTVAGLQRNKSYHFKVYLVDKSVSRAGSNIVKVTTKDGTPKPVTIVDTMSVTENQVSLRFTRSAEADFAYYCLWYDTDTDVDSLKALDTTSSRAEVISVRGDTTVTVRNLSSNTKYYFSMYTVDSTGLFSPSKRFGVTTKDSLFSTFAVTSAMSSDTSLTLSWKPYTGTGFLEYAIYMDTVPTVDSSSQLVRSITSATAGLSEIVGLKSNQQYYFRVYIRRSGLPVMKSNSVQNLATILENLPVANSSVPLIWRSKSSLNGFTSAKLYRSNAPILTDKLIPVKEFTSMSTSNHIDTVSSMGQWYYRLYYYSNGVLAGLSNQIVVTAGATQ